MGYGKQKGAKIHSHIKCATVCIILMSLINHFYVGAKSKDGRANAVFQACSRGAERERERRGWLRKWAWGVTHAAAAARAETLKLERRKVYYRYRAEGEGGRVGRRGDHG